MGTADPTVGFVGELLEDSSEVSKGDVPEETSATEDFLDGLSEGFLDEALNMGSFTGEAFGITTGRILAVESTSRWRRSG
jgi:hypothetical protein